MTSLQLANCCHSESINQSIALSSAYTHSKPHITGMFSLADLTLTSIQPASKRMHWTTLRRHSDLFWAATSTSSQVIPILSKSLLTVLLQFLCRWPGPLLTTEPPSAAPAEVCAGDPFVSHVQASAVFFHWVCRPYCVVQFWLWLLHLLLCPSRKCPRCSFQSKHLWIIFRVATHLENLKKSGNLRVVREKRKSQGKCVLAYGQLPRVLILTQNVQKRNNFLGTVVHHMKSERRKGFSYMQVVT